ncbi:MAG: RNA polymerase sigma-70 factor (ECF subfamily) [Flammeovirgaceae bacterium]
MDEHLDIKFRAILEGCREKRRNSQKQLYEHYYAYGMSVSLRYTHNEQDAVEVLNDCFLKVFKHIKTFDAEKPFKPWFRRILINTALNHIKKNKRIKLQDTMDNNMSLFSAEDIISKINYEELIQMVQGLSAAYKTVFNLYVIDGFKHEEIAKMLGISVGTSKSNLFKAKAKLKQRITNTLGYA